MHSLISDLNKDLFFNIYSLANQNTTLDNLMIYGADWLIFAAGIAILILSLLKGAKEKKALLLIFLSFGIAFILLKTFGLIIYEERPFLEFGLTSLSSMAPDDSFPSDHTTILAIIFFCYYYYRSRYAWIFLLILTITGFARVYVGVHYPSDILGGIIFAAVAVWLAVYLKNLLEKKLSQ
ncbi:MAG: phosphatase PAP2 family protein [Candidatus Daviesbacteria bacterium]|nr:phosphatase PAP2 family protein [Candidatus Daviesbacteria bacterium]